ncbi:MAG: metallophosphoesterase [Deltaproteobacteria bacterium]|jgi:predicted MPP superfamily phosphohydrolase|nr:metallophosphoesterase [Deltaproteobacteria bacterium]MBW2529852.1 metallophosphoesterase [Deltaproteobacteria bacterium]
MRSGPPLVGIIIILTGYVGLHLYMWARLIRSTELPPPWRRRAIAALSLLALYAPSSFVLARIAGAHWPRALIWPAVLWLGLALYLVLALVATDVARWLAELWIWIQDRERLRLPATRRRLYRGFAAAALASAATATGIGASTAACGPIVAEVDVPLRGLSPALDGLRIVQLSDLHVGRTIGRRYVEQVVGEVQALEPDLVVITGDLVDGTVPDLRDSVAPLFDLRPRHGVYFVTGNHDHYSGAGPWRAHLAAGGIRVLSNRSARIGEGEASLDLAGVEDPRGSVDLPGALERCDPDTPTVLLAHRPEAVFGAAPAGVDLQLSGHTHGGQLWPFTFFVSQATPYPAGLHRHGETWIYVSVGTGYVGPPIRLGTRAEITLLTLRREP